MKHLFKVSYSALAVATIVVDFAQMTLFLVLKTHDKVKEVLDDESFAVLSSLAQVGGPVVRRFSVRRSEKPTTKRSLAAPSSSLCIGSTCCLH